MEELPKQRLPESSSDEENDQQEQVKEDTATPAVPKRYYECTFCKGGFTNGQALGGHMNIHRKDRTKNKQALSGSSASSKGGEEYMNPSYVAAISSERASYYPVFETQRNCYMHFQQSATPNPRQHHCYYPGNDHFLVPRPQSLIFNGEELRGVNLSLQIGSTNIENSEPRGGVSKEDEDELDLELRLGRDP